MDSSFRIVAVGLLGLLIAMGCNESGLQKSAEALKQKLQQDSGVYTVEFGNRFGSDVIMVGCVTASDQTRIHSEVGEKFLGFDVHYVSPIWGIAGLDSANKSKFETMLQDTKSMTYGTEEWKIGQDFIAKATARDVEIWSSWDISKRGAWLKKFILERRRIDPRYANCGDKFLQAD